MAIIAPFCQYKKTNFKIGVVLLLVAAVWFAYDGFYSQKFKARHTVGGKPDSTLVFHKKSPPFFLAGAAALAVFYWKRKDKKIIADDEQLIFNEKDRIPYNSIESINKTGYDSKGFFCNRIQAA